MPITSGASTRRASSRSSCPVSSPSSTTIVCESTAADSRGLTRAGAGQETEMTRRGGWRRVGSKGRFRYVDSRGNRITDEAKLERIRALVIPPAWTDVWISSRPDAKLQAIGTDAAGRRQYRYHPDFRAQQEQAKYDKLIRFAERLPALREAMAEHMEQDLLDPLHVCAVAIRLINLAWFRVGDDRHAKRS